MWSLLSGLTKAITGSSTIRMQASTNNVILGKPDVGVWVGDLDVPKALPVTVLLL